ncbi:uncharacterized protein LOC133303075 [Gastrolobium bilobum]|uniref:uncharacterized protein LOC133303075 n=1 Tax=Gastrolobium bilobum TaxID=150636 RepID=UPI002AB02CDA|nr:uncharacterized protein LOC133303075 [Gastrolobium bilobum]XP_061358918.1 uncharacterized protein LOC133303075 [Gastrolobium bilobum]
METLHQCSILFFLGHHPRPPQTCPWRPFHPKPFSHSRISCSNNNFPRWDSNAETFKPRNFNFNSTRGKPQEQEDEDEEEEEEYGKKRRWWSDESPGIEEGASGVWEEAIDSMWVFKVFKSYGWMLPIILISWLVSSGPKAFLMALALPLGQSALSLAFEKLWGRSESKPKRKYRMRRKPSTTNGARVKEEPEENQKTRKGKTGYQSWVVGNNGSADMGSRKAPNFGGWDDLERSRPAPRSSRVMDGSQSMPMEAGRLSRRERKSDTPLLLRLLIAIFPFLGTWTKML